MFRRVERFSLLEEVDGVGPGETFAAYDPDLDRRVLLKVLPESESAFLLAAQAIAGLSHPNVITVHEARAISGQVYVSMEFVDGSTLRAWLAEKTRSQTEIVAIFIQVARGLAAAHAAGLVHGDVSLDNILIGRDGRARVTDFGLTSAHGEQADAASDQFSFAAALHEALSGVRPIEGAGEVERGPPRWLRQAVQRGLAPTPDARHATMGAFARVLQQGLRARARRRRVYVVLGAVAIGGTLTLGTRVLSDPTCSGADERLAGVWDPSRRREIRGALLAIDRPYAEATSRRVQRALDDYGNAWASAYVDACEATHVHHTQADALLDARMRCLERNRSRLAALVDVFAKPDDEILRNASEAVDALPSLVACADEALAERQVPLPDAPAVRARLLELGAQLAEAQTLETAGKYAEGLAVARRIEREADVLGYQPLQADALLRVGTLLHHEGEYAAGVEHLRRALWLARASGHDVVARDTTIALVSASLSADGTSDQALRFARAAWAEVERNPGHHARSDLLLLEGDALRRAGRNAEALPKIREAVQRRTATLGDTHPRVAMGLAALAEVQGELGEYEGAVSSGKRAVEILETALGPDHPLLASALSALATAHGSLSRHDEAVELQRRAQRILERSVGDDHPFVGQMLTGLGNSLMQAGRLDEALQVVERSIQLAEARLGGEHPHLARTLLAGAQTYLMSGKAEEGLPWAERGVAILEATEASASETDRSTLARGYSVVSNLYDELGRDEDAVIAAKRMLELTRGVYGEAHAETASARLNLGSIYALQYASELAKEQFEAALPVLKATLGADHHNVSIALNNLAAVHRRSGDHSASITAGMEALAVLERRGDALPRTVASLQYNIGSSFFEMRQDEQAVLWLDRANASYGRVERMNPVPLGDARFALAKALRRIGREPKRSRELARLARDAYREVDDRPDIKDVIRTIEKWLRRKS